MYRNRLRMDKADVCTGIGYIWMRMGVVRSCDTACSVDLLVSLGGWKQGVGWKHAM